MFAIMPITPALLFILAGFIYNPAQASPSRCEQNLKEVSHPQLLSETCLYSDIRSYTIAKELNRFTPNYQLWSDGAHKIRWIYLPPNTKINTKDPDRWVFPKGTQIFKEFSKVITTPSGSKKEIKVETRHLFKMGDGHGVEAWRITTYAWQEDQQDAALSKGLMHLGTGLNAPSMNGRCNHFVSEDC